MYQNVPVSSKDGIFWCTFSIELHHPAMAVYKDGDGFNENVPCTINIRAKKNSR